MGSLIQPLDRSASDDEYNAWMEAHWEEHSSLVEQAQQQGTFGVATGQFTMTASGALTGSADFEYIRIGSLNIIWSHNGIQGNAPVGHPVLVFSGLPTLMVPTQPVASFAGGLINGGSTSCLAYITILTDGTLGIDGATDLGHGVQGGQALTGLTGISPGFTFTFTTI